MWRSRSTETTSAYAQEPGREGDQGDAVEGARVREGSAGPGVRSASSGGPAPPGPAGGVRNLGPHGGWEPLRRSAGMPVGDAARRRNPHSGGDSAPGHVAGHPGVGRGGSGDRPGRAAGAALAPGRHRCARGAGEDPAVRRSAAAGGAVQRPQPRPGRVRGRSSALAGSRRSAATGRAVSHPLGRAVREPPASRSPAVDRRPGRGTGDHSGAPVHDLRAGRRGTPGVRHGSPGGRGRRGGTVAAGSAVLGLGRRRLHRPVGGGDTQRHGIGELHPPPARPRDGGLGEAVRGVRGARSAPSS